MIKFFKRHAVRCDVDLLHPWLKYKLDLLLKKCEKKGIYLIITEGYRTEKRQDELYAKGRTTKGKIVTNARGNSYQSQHQWGIAFDIALNSENPDYIYDLKTIKEVAKIAKKVGLEWGGDWKTFPDNPHFYLGKWGSTTSHLKLKYYKPSVFKSEWTKKVKGTKKGLNMWNKSHTRILKHKVQNGTTVHVMYKKGKFYKVECRGKVGYMLCKYLK